MKSHYLTKRAEIRPLFFALFSLGVSCANAASSTLQTIINDNLKDNSLTSQRNQLRQLIKWPDSCEETFDYPAAGFTFFKQNDNQYIVQIVCTYGSYQGMSLFYKISITDSAFTTSKIEFPVYTNSNNKSGVYTTSEIWGNVLIPSTQKEFKILNLYSGFGHCGSLTSYDLTGTNPIINKLQVQSDCETDNIIRNPEKWKTININ